MVDLDKYIVSQSDNILEVLKKIDENGKGIVFICDEKKLLASVTDGDIRRNIIKNNNLDQSVKNIGNYSPYFKKCNQKFDCKKYMREKCINSLPILDENMNIIDIKFLKEDIEKALKNKIDLPIVIMAGGKGTRLKPFTNILPKPLIPINEKTITEHILENFEKHGCKEFYMIINYKKNFIKSYFTELDKNFNIQFIEEKEFLGTGGGISLLKNKIKGTFFLTNCDIIINHNYAKILEKHNQMKNLLTIVCAEKNQVLPYGIINTYEDGFVKSLEEKPNFSFTVNTGVYIIEPKIFDYIPKNSFIHITEIIENCLKNGEKIGAYTLKDEEWLDMGQFDELEKMKERLEN